MAAVPTSAIFCGNAAVAGTTDADLLKDLQAAKVTLAALPNMVGDQQWDPVRNELRKYFQIPRPLLHLLTSVCRISILAGTPAVNALWNTMDSGNTLRKLAKSKGDPEIFEAAEEVARNLRDVDGMVYSNGFSMEGKMAGAGLRGDGSGVGGKAQGEGGGKYRVKEPQALLKAAIASIDEVLALE